MCGGGGGGGRRGWAFYVVILEMNLNDGNALFLVTNRSLVQARVSVLGRNPCIQAHLIVSALPRFPVRIRSESTHEAHLCHPTRARV